MSPDPRRSARLGPPTLPGIGAAPSPGQGLSHLWPSEDAVFWDLVAEGQPPIKSLLLMLQKCMSYICPYCPSF